MSYTQFDLKLAWGITVTGTVTLIEGVLQNLRYAHMEGVEVSVAAFDGSGARISRGACFVVPHQIRQNEVAPFRVRLPVLLPPGTRLEFTYSYRGSDGGDGGTTWRQSFEDQVPSPT